QTLSPFIHYKSPNRPLISQLLENRYYRKIYLAHLKTILEDYFSSGKFKTQAQKAQQLIDFYVKNDGNKLYTYEAFQQNLQETTPAGKSNIIGLLELMEARTAYLLNHPLLKKSSPVITEVRHKKTGENIALLAKIEGGKNNYLYYRDNPYAPFKKVKMLDDGQQEDMQADDQVFGFVMAYKAGIQYYIVSEGDKTASLSPKRAAFEFHEVK
ncbi:MAG: CotH kinase family protein, partial [Bacteroidota bacterium]